MKGWIANKDVRGLPGWVWQWCFHTKGMWSLEKSCTRVREKLMIFMVPKSHNSLAHLFHHDPPNCLLCHSSTLIKPSKSSISTFVSGWAVLNRTTKQGHSIGLGVWSWETAAALEQAVAPWLRVNFGLANCLWIWSGKGWHQRISGVLVLHLMFAWCLKSSMMVWIECRQDMWIFEFEPGSQT